MLGRTSIAFGAATNARAVLDHDVLRSDRYQDKNVIDCTKVEHDVIQKPVPTSWRRALVYRDLSRKMTD